MSLANVLLQRSTGFLMADAGVWQHGQLVALRPKLLALPAINAAVTVRGSSGLALDAWQVWSTLKTQAALLETVPAYVRRLAGQMRADFDAAGAHWEHIELTVVHWDAAEDRPRARQLNTAPPGTAQGYAAHVDGYHPYTWYDLPALALAPNFPAWDPAWPSLADISNESKFNARALAPKAVNAQREASGTVAGWVDMAAVTASGVTLERVAVWPRDGIHHQKKIGRPYRE